MVGHNLYFSTHRLSVLPIKVTSNVAICVKSLNFHFLTLVDLVVSVLLLFGDAEITTGFFFLGEGMGGIFPHFLASPMRLSCFIFWPF